MRGFRASRAAQNMKSSRFGNGTNTPNYKQTPFEAVNQQQNQKPDPHAVTKLPEWLRMPTEAKVVKISTARAARAAKTAKAAKVAKTTSHAKKPAAAVKKLRKAA